MAQIDWTEYDNSEAVKDMIPLARAMDDARNEVERLRDQLTKAEREREVLQDRYHRLVTEQNQIMWGMVRAANA